MKKMYYAILAIAVFFVSCNFSEETECYGPETQGNISFVTSFDYDSIRVYLGNQRICYGDMGGYSCDVICKTSLDSGYKLTILKSGGFMSSYMKDENGREKCIMTDAYPPWFYFSCSFNGGQEHVDMQVSTLTIETFRNGSEKIYKMENFIPGGGYSKFFPVEDPKIWVDVGNELSPGIGTNLSGMERIGCNNEMCLFQEPFLDEEFCFDVEN